MKVCVEMSPKEFTLSTRVTTFQREEEVDIAIPNGIKLTGRVESTKDAVYGMNQTPCTRIKIFITSQNITQHYNKYLRGAVVTGKRSNSQTTIYERDFCKFTQPIVRLQYLTGIATEVEELVKRATKVRSDALAKQWFGDNLTRVQLQRIHYDAAVLNAGLSAVTLMRFACSTSTGYLMACDLDNRTRYRPTICQLLLGKGFTYERYSWGEKVCTFAHELSHWFLGTKDEKYNGEDAYGINAFDMAKATSLNERRKCLNNAENWGYYICSYRDPNSGKDWKNMTRAELAAREPFNLAVQRVDQAIIQPV